MENSSLAMLMNLELGSTTLEKKVPLELAKNGVNDEMVTIGASHGWIATYNREDEILRDPVASDTDPKGIPLPLLVTLPHRQIQIITNVAMFSSSSEDIDCVYGCQVLWTSTQLLHTRSKKL